MPSPSKALADLRRMQKGGDVLSVKGGHETTEKVEQAIELLQEQTKLVQGALGQSEARLQQSVAGLSKAMSQAVNTLYEAVQASSDKYIDNIPQLDLTPVLEAVKAIPQPDHQPVIDAVESVLEAVQRIKVPEVDLTDVLLSQRETHLSLLDMEIPEPDLSEIKQTLLDIKESIATPAPFESLEVVRDANGFAKSLRVRH